MSAPRRRAVDGIVPVRSDRWSYQEAVKLAQRAKRWDQHPTRAEPPIALAPGVEPVWDEGEVTLTAGVIRFSNQKTRALAYMVLVTTDLDLSARWIVTP
jgi:hypothetical protein